MSQPPDYSDASAVFEQAMKDALAHLDVSAEEVRKEKEKAIEEQIAAREELARIKRDAQKTAEDAIEAHYQEYNANLKQQVLKEVAKRIILDGRNYNEVKDWTDLKDDVLIHVYQEIGFSMSGEHIAHVGYEDHGRYGYVIFYREDVTLRFYREFGGGLTLAIINVPTPQQWTKETTLPLEERMPILEFVAQRILRDQAEGHLYKITDDSIEIFLR